MGSSNISYTRRLTRFFVRPEQIVDETINFDADEAHHLNVVLRLRAGQACIALDDTGRSMHVEIDELNRKGATGHIVRVDNPDTEAQTRITIAQALPKSFEKLEWVLQHGTEIGVQQFVVFDSDHVKESWDRIASKMQRWRQIVKTAAEQSGRTRLPVITSIPIFQSLLSTVKDHDAAIMAYEGEQKISLREALPASAHDIMLVVGPEGGFGDNEVQRATEAGVVTASLGPRILRTETAALVMASQVMFALEPANKFPEESHHSSRNSEVDAAPVIP